MIEERKEQQGAQPEEQINIQEPPFPLFNPLAVVCGFGRDMCRRRVGIPASGHTCLQCIRHRPDQGRQERRRR